MNAKTPRNLEQADALVQKALDFIDELEPASWFLENPYTGLLKGRLVVAHLGPPVRLDYCRYGTPYRKRTAIWTNTPLQGALCQRGSRCPGTRDSEMDEDIPARHPTSAQRGGVSGKRGVTRDRHRLEELHRIPPALCHYVEAAARRMV